jgi:hypothetical protein
MVTTSFPDVDVIRDLPVDLLPDGVDMDDYRSNLNGDEIDRLLVLSRDTKDTVRSVVAGIIRIGENLIEAKDILHVDGKFHGYLVAEFGWTIRTAQNMMGVARMFSGYETRHWLIDVRALYLMASGSMPDHVRDFFISKADAGLQITYKDVRGRTSIDGQSICNVCGEIFDNPNSQYHCPECNHHSDADAMENGVCPHCGADTGSSMYPPMDDIEPLMIEAPDTEARPEVPPEERAARMLANMLWITNLEPESVVDYLDDIQRETVTDLIRWMGSFGKALKAAR